MEVDFEATHEWLSAAETNARFPQFGLDDSQIALYQEDFGVLFASKSVTSAWEYARALGVQTRTSFRAISLRSDASDSDGNPLLVVEGSDGSVVRARSVVLALGAWLSSSVQDLFGMHVPTSVSAETVCYYKPLDDCQVDHSYKSMPVFIPETDNGLGPFGYCARGRLPRTEWLERRM